MEDFVIIIVKKKLVMLKTIRIGMIWKFCVFWFLVFGFFSPLHMYNSNTDSLIIVGAHLTKK